MPSLVVWVEEEFTGDAVAQDSNWQWYGEDVIIDNRISIEFPDWYEEIDNELIRADSGINEIGT